MSEINTPIKDSRGNEAGSPGWRDINETWIYIGRAGELYMYQKLVGKYLAPDCLGLRSYVQALDPGEYKQMSAF